MPKSKGRKPATKKTRRRASPHTDGEFTAVPADRTLSLRVLFWQNFMREMLTSLSAMLMAHDGKARLDGRIAVLTHAGERIPISEVHPVFACSIPGSAAERSLSAAVQCSLFRIVTPEGEVFTLPLNELRAVHALSEELQKQLETEMSGPASNGEPFGFAAYSATSQRAASDIAAAQQADLPFPPEVAAATGTTRAGTVRVKRS